ncbi:UDP-glucose 6-dehydrogenase YwqF [compost metagenome]
MTIACFGLAFKPDIDDLRESPALAITQQISEIHTGRVLAVEPNISELPSKLAGKLNFADIETALSETDVLVLLVDHKEFKEIPIAKIEKLAFVDTRGIY